MNNDRPRPIFRGHAGQAAKTAEMVTQTSRTWGRYSFLIMAGGAGENAFSKVLERHWLFTAQIATSTFSPKYHYSLRLLPAYQRLRAGTREDGTENEIYTSGSMYDSRLIELAPSSKHYIHTTRRVHV